MTHRAARYEIATRSDDRRADRHRARLGVPRVQICAACGELILRSGPGRPPLYCSDRCRVAAWRQRQARQPTAAPAVSTMQTGGAVETTVRPTPTTDGPAAEQKEDRPETHT